MSQTQTVKNVVIAGGGTAGWMAAAALSKTMGDQVNLVLVESDEIETVGVGEATIPSMLRFHELIGIDEAEFLQHTGGTFKLGIKFENWRNINEHYIHAFGVTGKDHWAAGFQHFWLKGMKLGLCNNFDEFCLENQAAVANKFSHINNSMLNYAYHIDASKYANFLRLISEKSGVKRVEGKIESVQTEQASGFIESLTLASGETVKGDFFLDCTGFRALLIEQTLSTGFESWSHWLPCDKAIAIQTECSQAPVPYTRSIAHDAGWQWQIPLQSRTGNGIVFSSKFIKPQEALDRLVSNVEGAHITQPREISFATGKRRKQWHKNCLAVGLSSGFLEPLESTSIHLIQQNIQRFIRMFPKDGVTACDVNEFNAQANFDLDKIRDFIILHYKVTNRSDSEFWRYCRNMEVPESLAHRISLFEQTGRVFRQGDELFDDSWQQVMIGQGLVPQSYHPIVDKLSNTELEKFLSHLRANIRGIVNQLHPHQQYLQYYCDQSN